MHVDIRIGMGFDTHPLQAGYPLWVGGVRIASEKGAVGHSDADALVHALCDALLGAVGLGDIGAHFSNTDSRWQNIDSKILLQKVVDMLREQGWAVGNVDCTVCLEKPKIALHAPAMKQALAPILAVAEEAVSIKATTNERMGYVGREEGINAYAVAMVVRTKR